MTLRHGYFTGVGYTYAAYQEPSPERLALLSLLRHHRPPQLDQPFRLLELGCGQGVHLCLQAANYPQADFLGIDLQADHIAHARSLASAAGLANVSFQQADVLELERHPAPLGDPFDVVVAHGVLGWVSPPVGHALLRLASTCLRPGGLLYVSYNTFPGWLAALPFQHAIRSLQRRGGEGQPALDAARDLFRRLQEADAALFRAQPDLIRRLREQDDEDPAYLLHEYNHSGWSPLYANQVIEPARELGLTYLGSANLPENFESLLPAAYQQPLQEQQDTALKELVRDLLCNESFRRDVYAKGLDPLWPRETLHGLESLRVQRLADPQSLADDQSFVFSLGFGQVLGDRDWFSRLMDSFGEAPLNLGQLQERIPATPLQVLLQNLTLLIGQGAVTLVPPPRDPEPAHRFNALVAARVATGAPYRSLACPLSGNMMLLATTDLLAVHALLQGRPEDQLADALEEALGSLDRQPLQEGRPLRGEEGRQAIGTMALAFRTRTLPLLRRLGVLS